VAIRIYVSETDKQEAQEGLRQLGLTLLGQMDTTGGGGFYSSPKFGSAREFEPVGGQRCQDGPSLRSGNARLKGKNHWSFSIIFHLTATKELRLKSKTQSLRLKIESSPSSQMENGKWWIKGHVQLVYGTD
jgi:hypothetical protein